ncbi:PHD finger protein ALFIN-LIKE 1 isoform X2 [Elaeis guineensis]|uniref:PHD finger protein ALFIN-LIKE n=1 Tax=Elaeis guineensis var. tenera TaxID=51953 RepID=A0A8N4EX12_ELAGV|nr:PHD finger protein ALFIN-LIKE 1 isoform X2 [Elaeis guineensis]
MVPDLSNILASGSYVMDFRFIVSVKSKKCWAAVQCCRNLLMSAKSMLDQPFELIDGWMSKLPQLLLVYYQVNQELWDLILLFFKTDRKRLFSMINELPTVFEVVTDRKPAKDKSGVDSGSKSRHSTKRSSDGQSKNNSKTVDEGYGEDDDEHSETLCGICGSNYSSNEFWIACDVCERWFHGKCVKITPAKAENIKQYKCPSCSSKRGRQ